MDNPISPNPYTEVKISRLKPYDNTPVDHHSFMDPLVGEPSETDHVAHSSRIESQSGVTQNVPTNADVLQRSSFDDPIYSSVSDGLLKSSVSSGHMSEFELAIEVTAIPDLSPLSDDPSISSDLPNSPLTPALTLSGMDFPAVGSTQSLLSTHSSSLDTSFPSYTRSETAGGGVTSPLVDELPDRSAGIKNPRLPAPMRPPPFQPRTPSSLVAAADIDALLDSFPTPASKTAEKINSLTPSKSVTLPTKPVPPLPDSGLQHSDPDTNVRELGSLLRGGDPACCEFLPTSTTVLRKRTRSRSASRCSSKLPDLIASKPPEGDNRPAPVLSHITGGVRSKPRTVPFPVQPSGLSFRSKFCVLIFGTLLLVLMYYISAFFWGLGFGILATLSVVSIRNFLWSQGRPDPTQPRCHISGLPLGQLCCSVHCQHNPLGPTVVGCQPWWPVYAPALPPLRTSAPSRLRDLQTLTVAHMNDEDPNTSASSGPLGSGLGFKLDKNDRPVYRGWVNETTVYDPETHHVSRTQSVFITLDGTQLRLQRPRRNIARRSMWNDDVPSTKTVRFQNQRFYDLTHAQVLLLPAGLVSKRLWSRKYPICIRMSPQAEKQTSKPPSRFSRIGSTSVPNMTKLNSTSVDTKVHTKAVTTQPTGARVESRASTPPDDLIVDDGFLTSQSDATTVVLYLFGRTCREKEAWYRRLRAASLGVPLLWTPQLVAQLFLNATTTAAPPTGSVESRSDEETRAEADNTSEHSVEPQSDKSTVGSLVPPQFGTPGSREPLYVTYVRYMAKVMPASWLMRGVQALRFNVNHISCDASLLWLNALLARVFWDFLREAYWLERVRDKLQAKLKKIHLPGFISDLLVVGIDLGSELPVIRYVGRPYLDAHGLWIEADIAYAGGFSVTLETNVNLLRWNQRNRMEWEAANLADDVSSVASVPIFPEANAPRTNRRSSKLGAFLSDEEDSADSTTDSDIPIERNIINSDPVRRLSTSSQLSAPLTTTTSCSNKPNSEERPTSTEKSPKPKTGQTNQVSSPSIARPFQLASALTSRKRLIRIVDRITRSSYFQKAVDNKLVQRGMELLSNTPIVLEARVESLSGTLLINIPPPQSDRLWYGFRPSPQLRVKACPRVGAKAVTMSRILEWIENRVVLEFQRLVVLPNMDDISVPLLLSEVTAGGTK